MKHERDFRRRAKQEIGWIKAAGAEAIIPSLQPDPTELDENR